MAKKKNSKSSKCSGKNQSKEHCKSNKKNTQSKKFSDLSYADIILLASIVSYSIADELDEDDLAIFLVFIELLLADIQLLVAQKAIRDKSLNTAPEDEDIIDDFDLEID